MSLSAQDALKLARYNIEAARDPRSSKRAVIKHYRIAKKFLTVPVMTTDFSTLKERIAAYEALARVLDNSGLYLQEKAAKCRQRADALR